jgi:hypothetical protein
VQDVIDRAVHLDTPRDIMGDEPEASRADVRHVLLRPREQVVDTENLKATVQEIVTEVRTQEARPTRDHDPPRPGRHFMGAHVVGHVSSKVPEQSVG